VVLTITHRFRWAACQLDELARCLTRGRVREALRTLPKTLGETYARILRAIDGGDYSEEALKILTWLTYAKRPLTAIEVLQVTGIVLKGNHRFDEDEVLEDPKDILRICSSLVSVTADGEVSDHDATAHYITHGKMNAGPRVMHVRLAHFSVKEYLVSSPACIAKYRLQSQVSHDMLARSCLVYLLRFHEDEWQSPDCETGFPLARYAARCWTQHSRASGILSNQQRDLSVKLFVSQSTAFSTWMRFFDISRQWDQAPDIRRAFAELPRPLYVASQEGLAHAVSAILEAGADANAQGRRCGSALQAASGGGHDKVVQILVAAGADVNAQGGQHISALQVASERGYDKVVQILVAAGADVNAQGGQHISALQVASERGYDKVVQILVTAGADVNAPGGIYGSALQVASERGYDKVVQILVAAGADVNAQGGEYGSTLYVASLRGHEKVVQILATAGADVNAQGGPFGNALYIASERGHEKAVRILVTAGADVNIQGGPFGSSLQAASAGGYEKVVQILATAGADVNAQGGPFGNALYIASERGHERVVQILVTARAHINA
jgi:ankyrin repeat protein